MKNSSRAAALKAASTIEELRDAADALFRAARECCRQHDRLSRIVVRSDLEAELEGSERVCEACDDSLQLLSDTYERLSSDTHPNGADERWWRRANALWLASREFARRHRGCDIAARHLRKHTRDELGALHAEFELEASALLALRHAADAYERERPVAA